MATLTQLRNEASEALAKAKILAEARDTVAYEAAYKDYEEKRDAVKRFAAIEAEEKALGESEKHTPKPSDLREPGDADWVPGADKKELADGVDGVLLKGEDGRRQWMPYAGPGREGWIKGYPVSVQHPSILKRLPDDLLHKKALEEEAFRLYMRKGMAGFRNNEKLFAHLKDLQENTDSEGGYLVPSDQRSEIIFNPGVPNGVTRGISSVFTTTRDGGTWPRMITDTTFAAIAEEAAGGESDVAFGQVPFTIHKVGRNVDISEELLADEASNLINFLGGVLTRAKGRYEDQQAIEGDGTTEPLGLRVAGAHGTISDITDLFTLAAPTAVEVEGAFYELPAQYRNDNTYWHMTSSAFMRILSIGSTSAGTHLVDRIQDAVQPRILGRPVVFFDGTGWDNASTIAANEEIGAIGDFSNYYFIDRVGMSIRRSDDVAFRTDQVVFKARVRYDSLFAEPAAFLILKGAGS